VGAFLPPPGQPDPKMDPKFRSGSLPAVTTFNFDGVSPPSTLYIQRDDVLLLAAISDLSTEVVTFRLRMLLAPSLQGGQPSDQREDKPTGVYLTRGYVDTIEETLQMANAFATVIKVRALTEGYLLSAIALPANATDRGRTFAKAAIIRGGASLPFAAQMLFSDYTIAANPVTWPGGGVHTPIEGPGWVHSLQQANPAAGADWTLTALPGQRLAVKSFSATFAAAVAAASRNITVIVDDGVNIVWQDDLNVAVTASQTVSVNATQTNVTTGIVPTTLFVVLPPGLILMPGWRLRASTANIQGADQWSAIWFNVEEWLNNG
jgi:hypothetical protein